MEEGIPLKAVSFLPPLPKYDVHLHVHDHVQKPRQVVNTLLKVAGIRCLSHNCWSRPSGYQGVVDNPLKVEPSSIRHGAHEEQVDGQLIQDVCGERPYQCTVLSLGEYKSLMGAQIYL